MGLSVLFGAAGWELGWDRGAVDCVEMEVIELLKPLEDVGVIGLLGWVEVEAEVGEARSFCPGDSLVRFFFRNPKVGLESNGKLLSSGVCREQSDG